MRVVIQRVQKAKVTVDQKTVGQIEKGFMILLGVGQQDTIDDIEFLVRKIAHLRVFEDEEQKMNRSLLDTKFDCMVVSQFTLFADCKKGNRPSFIEAASPQKANEMYQLFVKRMGEALDKPIPTGIFGASMQIELINDGPVTIILDSHLK
jgi:D-tyrosyl-tRNA(Tyr) deacylase